MRLQGAGDQTAPPPLTTVRAALVRLPRRAFVWLAFAAAAGIGIAVWQLQGSGAAQPTFATVTASRGDVIVSVGGVGRIVEARASAQIALPTAVGGSAATAAAGGGGASAPADAVFPRAGGRVSRLLVAPGQHVARGQPLVLLDDGGSAAAGVKQAQDDLAAARLELRQKRTSDPLKGLPPTPAELAAGSLAVTSAQERLARLLGRPRPADVSAARLDLERAEADLETLLGGRPAAHAQAVSIAQRNVQLAQERLDRILAPPSPADVSAAQADVKKAEADLAELLRPKPPTSPDSPPPPPPTPEAVAAARAAVEAARLKLAKLLEPPNTADVTAARLELERAQAELRTLEAGPSPAALAAARQAVDASRARLAQLLGPPLRADVMAARLDVQRAEADLGVLRIRGGPASATDIHLALLKVEAARGRLALARFAERLLTVRAPSGGTVTGLLTVRGAPVDASTPIATVADLDHLAVSVDLSEFDAARVQRDLPAVVSVDALGGKSFPGKVRFVGLTGVDSGGVVTFPVRIGLAPAAGLKPGMNVSVRIIVAQQHDVVRVPLEAVTPDEEGHPTVTVIDAAGRTSPRRVTLGLANNKDVEIASGLRAGERVVLAGGQGE